jgi:UDP-N-acetylglucosamine pyrophosphorylase
MVHNVDTLGANIDPAVLGLHIDSGSGISFEVIDRGVEDRGGGLARIDGGRSLSKAWRFPTTRSSSS